LTTTPVPEKLRITLEALAATIRKTRTPVPVDAAGIPSLRPINKFRGISKTPLSQGSPRD
jgi:hypothetical protein